MSDDKLSLVRAWAFYRRSTDRQEVSVDVQRDACIKMAAKMGAEIVEEFSPAKGYASGLTIDRDPAFQRMVTLAETPGHGIRYLFVYNVSRFGRLEPEDKFFWDRRFKRAGVQVIYVMDDFKNDGSFVDVVTKLVKHQEAHQYSVNLSQVTLAGCLRHAAVGRSCGGSAPYGYARMLVDQDGKELGVLGDGKRKADKTQRIKWVVGDPLEVATVRRVYSLFARGIGVWGIVNALNGEGIASPRGKKWSKSMVTYMLQNEAYLGIKVYNRRDYKAWRRGTSRFWKPRAEWVTLKDAHPAIVDQELFDAVQKRRGKRKPRVGRPYYSPYLLSARLRCVCGHSYQGIPKYHNGVKTPCYTCGGYHNKGKHVCVGFTFPCEPVEKYVLAHIDVLLQQIGTKSRLKGYLEHLVKAELGKDNSGADAVITDRLQEVERQTRNLIDAIKGGGAAVRSLLKELEALETEKAGLQSALSESQLKARPRLNLDDIVKAIMSEVYRADKVLEEGSAEERKLFVAGFLEEGVVDPKNGGIEFRFYKIPFIQKDVAERAFASLGYPDLSKPAAQENALLGRYDVKFLPITRYEAS